MKIGVAPRIRSWLWSAIRVMGLLAILLWLFQGLLIYHPRSYDQAFLQRVKAVPATFTTSQGKQVAWVDTPPGRSPERVWLVFVGNGSLGLDFEDYFRSELTKNDAFVFFDYPSYGRSMGTPSPETIRESIRALVPAIAEQWGVSTDSLKPQLRIYGHSLGCAAALMAMEEYGIKTGVLVAPFTSMMDMSRRTVFWPLCLVLRHRFDNVAALERLQARAGVRLQLFHGTADEVIPFAMGKRLSKLFPGMIEFHPILGAGHNDIVSTSREAILKALDASR